jgi:hypothetical protein
LFDETGFTLKTREEDQNKFEKDLREAAETDSFHGYSREECIQFVSQPIATLLWREREALQLFENLKRREAFEMAKLAEKAAKSILLFEIGEGI